MRFQSVLEYLRDQGVAEADLQRIKAPAGLDIQAQQGDEIALSILAEIIQCRRGVRPAAAWSNLAVMETTEDANAEETASGIAIDLVCNMEVEIATAKYTFVYAGKTYYFCAPGCKTAFRNNPQKYLQTEHK
jgi:xanthine dehydrogenase accessory factor